MKYKNWTKEQKTALVLEALSREDLSSELTELIQGWILCEESTDRKDEIMDAILDSMFLKYSQPLPRTRESLARLHERLGLPALDAPETNRLPLRRILFRVAAVFIPCAILGGALWLVLGTSSDPVPSIAMVEVFRGEGGVVTLPDGSTVRPVGDSRVKVAENFTENRHVSLSGEAFFMVAADAGKPFTVETEELTVSVLGTEFNLEAWPDGTEMVVSLVTGSVKIGDGDKSVMLTPMEQLVYDTATGSSMVERLNPGQIDRWRFGRRELDDISLSQALDAVGDFYGKEVVIEGDLHDDLGISTTLTEDATVESALDAVRLVSSAFEYSIQGDTIHIVGE